MSVFILDKPKNNTQTAGFNHQKIWSNSLLNENNTASEAEELLKKIAKHNQAAFSRFYELYEKPVYSFLYKRCFNKNILEEVMQDIFITVWNKAAYFKPERGNPEQWLYTIARNRLYDYWRKLQRLGEVMDVDWAGVTDPETFKSDSSLMVEKTLNQLSEDYKIIITHIYITGLTIKECALEIGQPQGTVKWKVQQALSQMKGFLDKPSIGGKI